MLAEPNIIDPGAPPIATPGETRRKVQFSEWKDDVKKGLDVAGVVAIKGYVPEKIEKSSDGDRALRFTISDGDADRENDIIEIDGWEIDNYLANPVVLWSHASFALPIGRALSVQRINRKLVSTAEFATPDTYAFADTVYRLILADILRATSVGLLPLKYIYNAERGGFDIQKQELLEWSVVNIPANPRAMRRAKDAGIDMQPLFDAMLGAAEEIHGEPHQMVPVSRLKAVASALGYGRGLKLFELPAVELKAAVKRKVRGESDGEEAIETEAEAIETEATPATQADAEAAAATVVPGEGVADEGGGPTFSLSLNGEVIPLSREAAEAIARSVQRHAEPTPPASVIEPAANETAPPVLFIAPAAATKLILVDKSALRRGVSEFLDEVREEITAVTGRVF
jgi:hypothetical protein